MNIIEYPILTHEKLTNEHILSEYDFRDNERNAELLVGFDDLDRNLKKLSIWGCDFIILQVKLGSIKPFGARRVPFDNSEYFGIFSATTQALG